MGSLSTKPRARSHQEAELLAPLCGPPPTPHRLNTSNVLLIGDSISMGALESLEGDEMGYGAAVSRMLERMGAVHVQHNGGWSDAGQAGPSSKGVRCIRHWLGREQWDVVHANFGLHDIAKARGSNWSAVPPHAYVENLDVIFRHVQASLKPGGQFVWATTTPVPQSLRLAGAAPGSALSRNNSAVLEYNRLAAGLWESKRPGAVVVNDLYSLVTKRCGHRGRYGSFYRCALQRLWPSPQDADVHFNQEGREYLALAVASVIAQQLPCMHQARPHAAVVAANTVAAARRGEREAHHGKHTSRRRRRRLVAIDSQLSLRSSSSSSRHAAGSARFHRAAVVLSPPDTRVTAGGEPDARWRRTLCALQRTGAFALVLRHTPSAIAVTATSSPLHDDGSDTSAATFASTFASSTTSTSAAAASPAAASPAARARLASLLRRHGCRVVQSTLFGFSSLLRRFASHPLTTRVEWLYVFEDDAALVRPELTAAQVEAALASAERTADDRGVPMLYGGWCAARRECEQYDEPPAAPCPPSSSVASGPFHAARALARRFGLFARHALTGEAPQRCTAGTADPPRAASCAGLCAHSFAVRARALRGEAAAAATATAAGGNSDGLGARSTPLLDELLGSYLPDNDGVNALLVPFDRRLYTYARAKGGLPTALSDECRNASGGGNGGGGGGAGFCGLFSQDRRASPQDAKVVSEPCNPHSRTAYHHELMRRVPWGQTAPVPPHTMRVACVGDSLTRGDGAHLGGAVRRRIALFGNYPMRLQQALIGDGGGSGGGGGAAKEAGAETWLVRNFGRGGSTAIAGNQTVACHGYTTPVGTDTGARPHTRAYLGSTEFHAALQLLPHVVLLMLGSNDSTEPCWDGEAFSRGLQELVHAFRALPSRPALVLLVPPAPRHDGAARAEFGIRGAIVRKEVAQRVRALVRSLAAGASEAAAAPITTTASAATATAMACLPGTVHLLDMQRAFRRHGCADPASARCVALFANDSLHTSRAGADLIANTARPLVASCDRRRWAAPLAAPPTLRDGAAKRPRGHRRKLREKSEVVMRGTQFTTELRMLRSLLQTNYSAALYGRTNALNASALQLVYLSLLPPAALRTIRDRVGLCTLATGHTAPPASDRSWRCAADLGCFPACQSSEAPGHLLFSPGHGDADPRDAAWLWPNALRAEPVPSNEWTEVSHCAFSAGLQRACGPKCGPGLMWFFLAAGSGVSLNVGRTAVIDEVNAMSALGISGPALSRAISQLKREPNSTLVVRLRSYLGLSDRQVARLTTVQRINHRESTCLPRKHEIVLLLSPDDASYNHLSEASDVRTAAAALGPTRLQCGSFPGLFPCHADHPALRLMAQCSASIARPPRHSTKVRRHAGSCPASVSSEHGASNGSLYDKYEYF